VDPAAWGNGIPANGHCRAVRAAKDAVTTLAGEFPPSAKDFNQSMGGARFESFPPEFGTRQASSATPPRRLRVAIA